jgi:predicted phosphodiesterase
MQMKRTFLSGFAAALLALVVITSWAAAQDAASPSASQAPQFTFAVVSDLHMSEHDGPGYFKAFAQQIDALADKPEFVLVTGDIHVNHFKKALDEIKPGIPFHVVAGNHENRDAREELAKMFPNDFRGSDFYAFTHKSSLFIAMCDAATSGDHIGHLESEQIQGANQGQWLEEQLAQNSGKVDHTFIFAHIPPNPAGNISGGMFLASNDQKQLRELALKYKPTAMFFGHLHKREEFKIGETPVYVLPSLNWNFDQQPRGFMVVKVYKTGIATEFVPLKYSEPAKAK